VFDWPVPVHQRFCHFALDGWDGRSALRPVLFHIGVSFAGYKEQFDKAASCFTSEPHKTRAIVWELLWRLSEMADIDSSPSRRWMHPSLRAAVARIESSLEEPGSVEDLAREVGVSQSHLIRLFRARFGTTIVGYILRRRVQLAKHLLGHTDCRIKEIAHLVGIPDLHHFNKVIKRATGMAPRDYRRSAGMASEACSREER